MCWRLGLCLPLFCPIMPPKCIMQPMSAAAMTSGFAGGEVSQFFSSPMVFEMFREAD